MAADEQGAPSPRATDLELLVAGEHSNPHRVLGLHEGQIRALRPDAVAVRVLLAGGAEIDMERTDDAGVWVAEVAAAPAAYRFEIRHAGGTVVMDDPYRFEPTLSEAGSSVGSRRRDLSADARRRDDGVASDARRSDA